MTAEFGRVRGILSACNRKRCRWGGLSRLSHARDYGRASGDHTHSKPM
jgi:hypothetical protein